MLLSFLSSHSSEVSIGSQIGFCHSCKPSPGHEHSQHFDCSPCKAQLTTTEMRIPQSTTNDGEAAAGPSSPPATSRERAHRASVSVDDEERSRSAELARMQTVDFLSRLTKEGYAREYRKRETDDLVERCFFSCSQTSTVIQSEYGPYLNRDRQLGLARLDCIHGS